MLHIKGIDHLELYVGNVPQTAYFYRTAFGFTPTAIASLETGARDRMSMVLRQNEIIMVVTGALSPDSPIAKHVDLHGDSVKDIAFAVDDAAQAFAEATSRGARPVMEPTVFEQNGAHTVKATVAAYSGDTVHSFVQRAPGAPLLPNSVPIPHPPVTDSIGLLALDHAAICVEADMMQPWVDFYVDVMDFHVAHQEDVATEYTGMYSKQVENALGTVKFPIAEPAPSKRKSQINEYLSFHHGAGVQHVALLSGGICDTVRALRRCGIEFLKAPDSYYDRLEERVGKVSEDLAVLRELSVLVDRDPWGQLLQVFTKPLQARPTVFMEIIQRLGARGFGGGNIRSLFEAIESEQAARGTL
jgi:4-hydroxyphenylpyruvate dioxygenase